MLLIAGVMANLLLLSQDLVVWNPFELGIDIALLILFSVYFILLRTVKKAGIIYRLSVGSLLIGLLIVAVHSATYQSKTLLLMIFPPIYHILFGNREGPVWSVLTLLAILAIVANNFGNDFHQTLEFVSKYTIAYGSISAIAFIQEWGRKFYFDRLSQENKKLNQANQKIRRLSVIDTLTGLYNRRFLDEELGNLFHQLMKSGQALAFILCDIDHFKAVNDRHGHQVGDKILKRVSKTMSEALRRNTDWIARYGGEEFLIVLPATTLDTAGEVAERIRTRLHKPGDEEQAQLPLVTASFGVAAISDHRDIANYETLISMADKALYSAKQTGRDKVVAFNENLAAK